MRSRQKDVCVQVFIVCISLLFFVFVVFAAVVKIDLIDRFRNHVFALWRIFKHNITNENHNTLTSQSAAL